MITLTPAYGRDYKSAKAAKEDFAKGKDFLINQYGHPYDGKPANVNDLEGQQVQLRFCSLRKVCTVKATKERGAD
jgi:hypothetical protein